MKTYEYKFIKVPLVTKKKGITDVANKGETFEACKDIIIKEAQDGW